MNKTNKLQSKESRAGADNNCNKWQQRGLKSGLAVVALGVLLLLASQTEIGQFYLTVPTMSRAEFNTIVRMAHEGDAESQLYYGVFFANGDGIRQNYSEAVKWYLKSADQGNARAQRNLAQLYDYGLGVAADPKEAAALYFRASVQNDAAAHFGIAALMFTNRVSALPGYYRWPIIGRFYLGVEKGFSSDYKPFGNHEVWILKAHYLIGSKAEELSDSALFWKRYELQDRFSQKQSLVNSIIQKRAQKGDPDAQLHMATIHLSNLSPEWLFCLPDDNNEMNKRVSMIMFDSRKDDILHDWILKSANNNNHFAQFILSQDTYYTNYRRPNSKFIPDCKNIEDNLLFEDDIGIRNLTVKTLGISEQERMEWLRKSAHCKNEPFFLYTYLTDWRIRNSVEKYYSEFNESPQQLLDALAESDFTPAKRMFLKNHSPRNNQQLRLKYALDLFSKGDLENIINENKIEVSWRRNDLYNDEPIFKWHNKLQLIADIS